MKEISEINKKINLGSSGTGVTPVAKAPERRLPPGMTAAGGLGFVNELAPHLRGGT